MTGHAGDTLASALLANGVSLFGRSFKYHRPRGLLSAGIDEPNALVTVLRGEVREPNIPATAVEIYDGLAAVSQNRFPSLAFDVGAGERACRQTCFRAGFYYKTFMGPVIGPLKGTRFWMLCEHFIRRAAGLGRAGLAADTARYERMNAFCDVLVVGSGPAGIMAATAAAETGAQRHPGRTRSALRRLGQLVGRDDRRHARGGVGGRGDARPRRRVTMCGFCRARRCGATMTTTRLPHRSASPTTRPFRPGASRATATGRSAPRSVVLATGAFERPFVFPGQ